MESKRLTVLIMLAAVTLLSQVCAGQWSDRQRADLGAILDGVHEIGLSGVPGPLVVLQTGSMPVAVGGWGRGLHAPVVAVGHVGRGRAVAFGHTGYLHTKTLGDGDTTRLFVNLVRWASPRTQGKRPPRVGVRGSDGLVELLESHGVEARDIDAPDRLSIVNSFDAIVIGSHALTDSQIKVLQAYMRQGGSVITAGLGWGWLQLNPGKTLDEHPGNRLLAIAGIRWADGTLSRTSERGGAGYDTRDPVPAECHAKWAMDMLMRPMTPDTDIEQAGATATLAVRSLPVDDRLMRPRLRVTMNKRKNELMPTQAEPLGQDDALDRLLLAFQVDELSRTEPARVRAHPSAKDFPGSPARGATSVEREFVIDASVPGWHSTGLYAPAGRLVRVESSEEAFDVPDRDRPAVRIGAHKDELWHKPDWRRVPAITVESPISEHQTLASCAFGGLVYIVVPRARPGVEFRVVISGAVDSPHFVLGETSTDEWRRSRRHPGPWGELETANVILTVPSDLLREIDDPTPLMELWDGYLNAAADLAQRPRRRERPERYVADVQISAGYMHSGYPIMTHLDGARFMTDYEALRVGKDAWGLVHELGHNHQSGDWTFGGTGEVTCNLFSLYCLETVSDMPDDDDGHGAVDQSARLRVYLEDGAPFDQWKSSPFLALYMYVQMQREFGWDPFKRVFKTYRELPNHERPKGDDQKRDQWMVRFSREVGRDLGGFFEVWGVPTSDEARQSIADLPAWMPEEIVRLRADEAGT